MYEPTDRKEILALVNGGKIVWLHNAGYTLEFDTGHVKMILRGLAHAGLPLPTVACCHRVQARRVAELIAPCMSNPFTIGSNDERLASFVWLYAGQTLVAVIQDLPVEARAFHINPIAVPAGDVDAFVYGVVDAFTKKVTGEMAIPLDFGPLTTKPAKPVCACGDPKCGQPADAAPPLIEGLTPGECCERWEANAAAIESGMVRPYALSPAQIAEGKRLHLEARKAGR